MQTVYILVQCSIVHLPIDTALIPQSPTIPADNIVPPVVGEYNSTVVGSPQSERLPNMYI